MAENVIHLVQPLGDGAHIDADQILEANKGEFITLVLCGLNAEGRLVVAATDSAAESVFLLERAKHFIVVNDIERT